MPYLLDTSTLAETIRAVPSRALVRRLSSIPSRERWTSVITVSQLLVAARRTQQPRVMQDVVSLVAAIRVAPFDVNAAQSFAKFRATVAPEMDADDVMIAAIAASGGYTLATKRVHEFSVFPHLRVEDWTI
ncbi:MAG: PIN domain-containing protein [Polyangiaceae bacterium]|nr:PIN domain-containing protein [Polyangiaceae bacterium]